MKEYWTEYILKLVADVTQKLPSCDLYSITPVPLLIPIYPWPLPSGRPFRER